MANVISTDFRAIHMALNKLIIGEVKAALRLLPDMWFKDAHHHTLCRITVSPDSEYSPRDLNVKEVWVDGDDLLHIEGEERDDEWANESEWTEGDDMLDITDFQYLISQIGAALPDGKYDLTNAEDLQALIQIFANR